MPVMYAMLSNAAVAAVLALVALAVGRVCRSPAVRHFLWVLVLLKLVTPPLFHVPLAVLPPSSAIAPAPFPNKSEIRNPKSERNPNSEEEKKKLSSGAVYDFNDSSLGFLSDFGFRISDLFGKGADRWIFAVWIAGAAGWFIWQGRRIVRFRRRVARAKDAGPEVAAAASRIAKALGVGRAPAVKSATGIGSPMLWGWGRGTVILFPRELLARLAPEARDTLLAHELAHFLRRDHWVRLLEFLAAGLYWWHPAVWVARAGIEAAEEECCDALVVGELAASPRRYAEALLATLDFIAELHQPCLPPGACPANRDARLLYHRLAGIAHAGRVRPLRWAGVIRTAAVVVLLLQPMLRAAPSREERGASGEPAASAAGMEMRFTWQRPLPVHQSCPPKRPEPPAWATASTPNGAVTAMARDNEVVLRRPDGTVKALGPGKPLALAFAPNEQRLATAGPRTLVRLWDYWGNLLAEADLPSLARSIAYTPNGSCILVLDAAGGISVRNPHTLAVLSEWTVKGPANSITCAPDSQTVAVAFGSWLDGETGYVELWSIAERTRLRRYDASAPIGATRFAPDGEMLVIGGWNGLLAWLRLPGGEVVAERQLPKNLVAATSFSPDARTLPLDPPPKPPELPAFPSPIAPGSLDGISQLPGR